MSETTAPEPTGPEVERLRARVAELEADNARLDSLLEQWRAVGLAGWTEPDPVPPQDDLTTLKNLLARCVLAPLRAAKRASRQAAGRIPAVRRSAIRAQVALQARARRR